MGAEGTWFNELGSRMAIDVSGTALSGSYQSKVGQASGVYQLAGQINPDPSAYAQALAWTVAWTNPYGNAHSATAWSGELQTIDGDEEIVALWLLTHETAPESNWGSTQVGRDVFRRTPPSPEEIERNRRRVNASHPVR